MASGQSFSGETVGQQQKVDLQPLQIDIVSDVVCPWCIIGYKQLLKALAAMPGQFDVTINWHPFELNPAMPDAGQDLREHIALKYGTSARQSLSARNRLTELGESLGFTFDYFEGMRMVNTFLKEIRDLLQFSPRPRWFTRAPRGLIDIIEQGA